jgi:hypothetical protein
MPGGPWFPLAAQFLRLKGEKKEKSKILHFPFSILSIMILVYIVTKCKSNHTQLCERIWRDKQWIQIIQVHCRILHRDICIIATDKSKYAPPEEVPAGATECAGKLCHCVEIRFNFSAGTIELRGRKIVVVRSSSEDCIKADGWPT